MARAVALVLLVLAASPAVWAQTLAVLHIRATLTDPAGRVTPVARHALLISDNPPTREPRRVVMTLEGTADVRLRPGKYTVESDTPVMFQGKAYHWTQIVDVGATETTLELTVTNAVAEIVAPGTTTAAGEPAPATDTSLSLRQWLDSVVELWTPTTHASGFLVDATGLIATNQKSVRDATSVEVQISRSVKVAGSVVATDAQRDIALIRIDPSVMASVTPVPLGCARPTPLPIARGQEIFSIAAPLRQEKGWTPGTVSRAVARVMEADLILADGGTGGPVFNASGDLAGITTLAGERDEPRRGATRFVRADACDLVAAAVKKSQEAPAPSAAHLPVEPLEPAPVATFKEAIKKRAGSLKPYQIAATEFDVAFIPPLLTYAAQSQADQNFGNWSEYAADVPPVLFIRVTPKQVESLWAKVARGAAVTQGMALPAIKHTGAGFLRLRALCGSTEVQPVHPLKLEVRVSDTEAVYAGLYAFDPAALGPSCGTVTLVLFSEKDSDKGDTRVVPPGTLRQIWQDLELK